MTPPDLADFLGDCRARVDAHLDKVLPPESESPTELHRAMRYAVFSGGKRLRPALAYAGAEAGGADPDAATPIAAAVELVHAYSLVHDDLPAMDDDDERRGRPTVHVAFGEANAILTGDALLAEAFAQLDRAPPGSVARLAHAAGSRALVGGQVDDLAPDRGALTLDSIVSIHERKTAALFRFAVWGGGAAAGLDARGLDALDAFGLAYGRAFQLTDDLLDDDPDECSILRVLPAAEARERALAELAAARDALRPLDGRAVRLGELAKQLEGRLP